MSVLTNLPVLGVLFVGRPSGILMAAVNHLDLCIGKLKRYFFVVEVEDKRIVGFVGSLYLVNGAGLCTFWEP